MRKGCLAYCGVGDQFSVAFQIVVDAVLPIVLPEGAAPRQPLHQSAALVFVQALNGLRHGQAVSHLRMCDVPMALQFPSILATCKFAQRHHAADRVSEGRGVCKLSVYREIVEKELHLSTRLLPIPAK